MKKIILTVFMLVPLLAITQYDLDTRYFTINAESLPDIERTSTFVSFAKPADGSFTLDAIPTFNETLRSSRINTENYWQPVDMMAVAYSNQTFLDKKLEVAPLKNSFYGFSGYTSDGSTSVKNIVYKEARGLNFLDACPPFGICPRCAHYRVNRGF